MGQLTSVQYYQYTFLMPCAMLTVHFHTDKVCLGVGSLASTACAPPPCRYNERSQSSAVSDDRVSRLLSQSTLFIQSTLLAAEIPFVQSTRHVTLPIQSATDNPLPTPNVHYNQI